MAARVRPPCLRGRPHGALDLVLDVLGVGAIVATQAAAREEEGRLLHVLGQRHRAALCARAGQRRWVRGSVGASGQAERRALHRRARCDRWRPWRAPRGWDLSVQHGKPPLWRGHTHGPDRGRSRRWACRWRRTQIPFAAGAHCGRAECGATQRRTCSSALPRNCRMPLAWPPDSHNLAAHACEHPLRCTAPRPPVKVLSADVLPGDGVPEVLVLAHRLVEADGLCGRADARARSLNSRACARAQEPPARRPAARRSHLSAHQSLAARRRTARGPALCL
jgi:hypothetical protein